MDLAWMVYGRSCLTTGCAWKIQLMVTVAGIDDDVVVRAWFEYGGAVSRIR